MSDDKVCKFCLSHEAGDTIFDETSWDGGIGFDYIRNIQYCPICGKKLSGNDEEKDNKEELETTKEEYICDISSIVQEPTKHIEYGKKCPYDFCLQYWTDEEFKNVKIETFDDNKRGLICPRCNRRILVK